jgi:hypothetical protein
VAFTDIDSNARMVARSVGGNHGHVRTVRDAVALLGHDTQSRGVNSSIRDDEGPRVPFLIVTHMSDETEFTVVPHASNPVKVPVFAQAWILRFNVRRTN